jgi:hypothetical protein
VRSPPTIPKLLIVDKSAIKTGPGYAAVSSALIAEPGVDIDPVPSAAHLASWGEVLPANPPAAGAPTPSSAPRYLRLARRRGKQKAIVATGKSVLTVIYRLLSNPEAILRPRVRVLRIPDQQTPPAPATSPPSFRRSPPSTSPSATAKHITDTAA